MAGLEDFFVNTLYDPNGNQRSWLRMLGQFGAPNVLPQTLGKQAPAKAPAAPAFSFAGTPASYIIGPESGGDPYAANPRSSAAGLGQFLEKTWMDPDLRQRAGFGNINDASWKALRSGPQGAPAQIAMTNAYAQRNASQWEARFGRTPTPGQVYGMHFLDAPGFIKLTELAAQNPNAKAAELFPDAAKANPEIFKPGATAAQVYNTLISKANGPWAAPQMQQLDVSALQGMVPSPPASLGAAIALPDAPQRGALPARPTMEQIDIPALTAMFEKYAPKAPDEARSRKLEFSDMLAGMAAGAMSVDPNTQGIGAMLLAIGAGGLSARAKAKRMTDQEQQMFEEASRQFGLDIAKLKYQAEEANRGTRNANAQITWQDAYDELERQFANKSDQWKVDMQEAMTNIGRGDTLAGLQFQTAQQRGQVGIEATQANTQLANQQAAAQAELDLKQYLYQDAKNGEVSDALTKKATALVNEIGIDPKVAAATKDPVGINAFRGAGAIAAKNAEGAMAALGAELVDSGAYADILDEETAKEIEKVAKRDPVMAGRLLGQRLAQKPEAAMAIAEAAKARGLPMGTLIVAKMKTTASATPAPAPKPKDAKANGTR